MNSELLAPITVAEAQRKLSAIQQSLRHACGRDCNDIVVLFNKRMSDVMRQCREYSRQVAPESVAAADVPLTMFSEAMLTASVEIEAEIAGRTLAFRRDNPVRLPLGSASVTCSEN